MAMVLTEAVAALAYRATNTLYEEKPDLWRMGERGRARTLEDFGHHFEALATMDRDLFAAHVAYCEKLFANHGFPAAWLTDAWRVMADTVQRELPPTVADQAIQIIRAGPTEQTE
ncbi:MAG TPA: hypothetical protein VLS53_01180 [Candidatus Dormibacteraeota bacterium]|nr:hypothetical protein [Candidatus Dormibacteraeota bacterium]